MSDEDNEIFTAADAARITQEAAEGRDRQTDRDIKCFLQVIKKSALTGWDCPLTIPYTQGVETRLKALGFHIHTSYGRNEEDHRVCWKTHESIRFM